MNSHNKVKETVCDFCLKPFMQELMDESPFCKKCLNLKCDLDKYEKLYEKYRETTGYDAPYK